MIMPSASPVPPEELDALIERLGDDTVRDLLRRAATDREEADERRAWLLVELGFDAVVSFRNSVDRCGRHHDVVVFAQVSRGGFGAGIEALAGEVVAALHDQVAGGVRCRVR